MSQVKMVASFPKKAPVTIVALSEAWKRETAPLCSCTTSTHWDSPLLQPLCEPLLCQQVCVIEEERAVYWFGKCRLRVSAGSDEKHICEEQSQGFVSLSPVFLFCLFFNGRGISVPCNKLPFPNFLFFSLPCPCLSFLCVSILCKFRGIVRKLISETSYLFTD